MYTYIPAPITHRTRTRTSGSASWPKWRGHFVSQTHTQLHHAAMHLNLIMPVSMQMSGSIRFWEFTKQCCTSIQPPVRVHSKVIMRTQNPQVISSLSFVCTLWTASSTNTVRTPVCCTTSTWWWHGDSVIVWHSDSIMVWHSDSVIAWHDDNVWAWNDSSVMVCINRVCCLNHYQLCCFAWKIFISDLASTLRRAVQFLQEKTVLMWSWHS